MTRRSQRATETCSSSRESTMQCPPLPGYVQQRLVDGTMQKIVGETPQTPQTACWVASIMMMQATVDSHTIVEIKKGWAKLIGRW